jgi:hypothetical protein
LNPKKQKKETSKMNMMFVLLTVLLSVGFVAMGTNGTTSMEDRTAENTEQVRAFAPPGAPLNLTQSVAQDCHTHNLGSWRCSPRKNKRRRNTNKNNNNNKGRPQRQRLTWKEAICAKSKGLVDWHRIFKYDPSKNRDPLTKFQRRALNKLRLKTPYECAVRIVQELLTKHIHGEYSIQSVINDEAATLLVHELRSIDDPSIRMDYLLHVLNQYGSALNKLVPKDNLSVREQLTLTPLNLVNVVRFIDNEGLLYKGTPNIKLNARAYTIAKDVKGITPIVNSMLYGRSNTAFQKLIRQEAEDELDDYIKNKITSDEDLELTALILLKKYTQIVKDMETGVEGALDRFNEIPEKYQSPVMSFKAKGATMVTHSKESDMYQTLTAEVNELQQQFVNHVVADQKSEDLTREEHLKNLIRTKKSVKEKENSETRHSWEIRITRTEGKKTEVTLSWHLSHMSLHREKGKKIVENNHLGMKYLLGPSNGVQMPERVDRGYLSGAETIAKHGGTAYTGDAGSLQCLLFSGQSPHIFTVRKDMKVDAVEKVSKKRNNLKPLYTLINVVLGTSRNIAGQESYRLAGLYTHPQLIKDGAVGQMRAVAIDSWTKPQEGNNTRRNTNKNQRKNRKAKAEADAAKNATVDEATAEEIHDWNNKADELVSNQVSPDVLPEIDESLNRIKIPVSDLPRSTIKVWLKPQIQDELKRLGQPYSGNKDELVDRLMDAYAEKEFLSYETILALNEMNVLHGTTLDQDPVWTKPKASKKKASKKLPPSRGGRDNSS